MRKIKGITISQRLLGLVPILIPCYLLEYKKVIPSNYICILIILLTVIWHLNVSNIRSELYEDNIKMAEELCRIDKIMHNTFIKASVPEIKKEEENK